MNNTGDIKNCYGCGVCAVICPHNIIALNLDKNGFYKATVSAEKCSNCGLCLSVCANKLESKAIFENTFKEKSIYAAWSKNPETVKSSSSGGVGYELTSYFFEKGYQICGCVLDAPNDSCKHIITQSEDDLQAIKSSKYLQSFTAEAFSQFEKDKKYLVIGTPCQIYGLRKYIQQKQWEDNFILVDFFCHGTPSFNLWKKYKDYLSQKHQFSNQLKKVNFRLKNTSSKWHSYGIFVQDSADRKFEQTRAAWNNLFFKFFLNESCLNNVCYDCKFRLEHCYSDIRLADFWGKKYEKNEWGVSLVITNTEKGQQAFDAIKSNLNIECCNFEDLKDSQGKRFILPHKKRTIILSELQGEKSLDKIYRKHFGLENWLKKSIVGKGISFIKKRI